MRKYLVFWKDEEGEGRSVVETTDDHRIDSIEKLEKLESVIESKGGNGPVIICSFQLMEEPY
jgi:hypothetical protein